MAAQILPSGSLQVLCYGAWFGHSLSNARSWHKTGRLCCERVWLSLVWFGFPHHTHCVASGQHEGRGRGRWDLLPQLVEEFAEPELQKPAGLSPAHPPGTGAIHGAARRGSPAHQGTELSPSSPMPRSAGGGTVGITFCSWQELNLELRQHQEDLAALEHLAAELGSCGFAPSASLQQEKLQSLKKEFLQLQKVAEER